VAYTAIHNVAGTPAMSVPLGASVSGLPIGVQFAARRGDEATLLALAYELEAAAPWAERWPGIAAARG
jgi:amidase